MTTIADQPPPKATTRRPAWDLLVAHMVQRAAHPDSAYGLGPNAITMKVIADMRERDQVGRQQYGTPLTADNGRNHLVDAYQEGLDFAVYLTAWLDERGYRIDEPVPLQAALGKSSGQNWKAFCIQCLLYEQERTLLRLRAFIDDDE